MECTHLKGFSAVARDHAAHPRNHGPLSDFNGHARITGPCGDTMEFWLAIDDGKIQRVCFITDGCGTSRACGSMATSLVEGRRLEDAASLKQKDILDALKEFPKESEHCALLAANTLKAACDDFVQRQAKPEINPIAALDGTAVPADTIANANS